MREDEQLHQVQYGSSTIDFLLRYSGRKTLGINVYPDKSVKVTAPANAHLEKVLSRVGKKARWIQKQQRKFSVLERPAKNLQYISGESLFYLGRRYRLRILKGSSGIKITGKFIYLALEDKQDRRKAKKLLSEWYNQNARKKLSERFERHRHIIEREKINFNSIIIRLMEKRWGSCTERGNVILNTELIKVPVDCIDYVIIHEICHLKFLRHNRKFYKLMAKYLPAWDKKKKKLELY
ncbi:MAG: M48 family metallopeptidase [Bacteroidetes bacterium]|nr:M48 family peptidase [Bacteroidota bacterium]NOG95533.1 M48 family metallopeptidase [Bacteroidota bacterium]